MLAPEALDEPITDRRAHRAQALGEEFCRFRQLIGKLGGGERTSSALSRAEAAEAITLMLQDKASSEQIAAFLIAHRLRRPQPLEMAGFLDAYRQLGPQLPQQQRPVVSFGVPFDGRCREAPILPLTALVLASAGLAVVLQGSNPMPVKYGAGPAELLAALDLPLAQISWDSMGRVLQRYGLALLHQAHHFPAAERLVPIRERIGKRPPIATLELLWSCYPHDHCTVSGFVHAPTEALTWQTWDLIHQREGITVKGLEGSTDLPTGRVAIAAHWQRGQPERLVLHARDHGLRAEEPALSSLRIWQEQALAALNSDGPLRSALIWNAGFYLWRLGRSDSLAEGLAKAEALLREGAPEQLRRQLQQELKAAPSP